MGWLYLTAALFFPAVIILWRPTVPLPGKLLRIRLAGSIVIIWLLLILWGLRPAMTSVRAVESEEVSDTQAAAEMWETDAPADTGLILLLGWVPGLVYAGLLILARKAMERPTVERW